jgi:hypothetical protein
VGGRKKEVEEGRSGGLLLSLSCRVSLKSCYKRFDVDLSQGSRHKSGVRSFKTARLEGGRRTRRNKLSSTERDMPRSSFIHENIT